MLKLIAAVTLGTIIALPLAACGDDDDGGGDNGGNGGNVTPGVTAPANLTPVVTPQLPNPDVVTAVALDANAGTPEVDAAADYPTGTQFRVAFDITEAGGEYMGYQVDFEFDNAVITYDAVEHLRPEGLETCSPTRTFDGNRFAAFCLETELLPVSYTGPVTVITFTCAAPGETELRLRTPADGSLGTKIQFETVEASYLHTLTLANATIRCT